jgi:glutamyl-tRNA synthetase
MVDFVFLEHIALDPSLVVPKRWDVATTSEGLLAARAAIAALGEVSFEAEELEAALRALCDERGWKPGDLFMAVRVAITGRTATPPLFDTMVCLGYTRTLERLDAARVALAEVEGT